MNGMSDELETIERAIAAGKLQPVYVLYGDEPAAIRSVIQALRRRLIPPDDPTAQAMAAFNHERFDGADLRGAGPVLAACQQMPMLAQRRLVELANPDDMAKLRPLMGSVNAPGNPEKDAAAYIAYLDAQKQVDKKKKIGTQGYCMGGPLVVRTAAAFPDRIGAGASFHGGGLVTDKPESPHLLAPKIRARMYFGVAGNDDQRQPDAKVKLKEAFEAAKVPVEVELYPNALHGWCIADMPLQGKDPIYNKADAERAWAKLVALYKAGLA